MIVVSFWSRVLRKYDDQLIIVFFYFFLQIPVYNYSACNEIILHPTWDLSPVNLKNMTQRQHFILIGTWYLLYFDSLYFIFLIKIYKDENSKWFVTKEMSTKALPSDCIFIFIEHSWTLALNNLHLMKIHCSSIVKSRQEKYVIPLKLYTMIKYLS